MGEEETMFEDIIKAIEGTESSAELTFEDIRVKLPGVSAYIGINGKVTITARPVHDRGKK